MGTPQVPFYSTDSADTLPDDRDVVNRRGHDLDPARTPERRSPCGSEPLLPGGGPARVTLLESVGDRELPDARLTAADRRHVKRLLTVLEPRLSCEALMFLSCGAEDAARRKRSREGRNA